jgi:hypothetical protein
MSDLTNQYISASFDKLLQVETTGTVTDGLGVQPSNFILTNVTASNISATTFVGDGSGLTGITAEWDGSHNGNASITGSLVVTSVSGSTAEFEIYSQDTIKTNANAFTPKDDAATELGLSGARWSNGYINNVIAVSVSGSMSGSFEGDGTNLTGITAEWDGSHNGNASITGSLIVSSSAVDFSKTTNVDVNQLRMVPNGTTNSRIQFSGSYSSSISLVTEDSGSIVFEGNTGGLFSIEDSKDGVLSATSDVSGNPILLVDANWNVYAGSPFTEPWLISSGSHNTTNVYSGSATTATQSINLLNGHHHYMSCSVDTLFTFTNPPVTDRHYEFNLELIKDATAATRSLTYTDTVLWPQDVGLTELTASGEVSIAKFQTRNGGSSWYGTIVGRDFK